jgi:predicted nucleic acid-binding protein
VIVDSGILFAAIDRTDAAHAAAVEILRLREMKVVPAPVVTETAWLVGRRLGVDGDLKIGYVDAALIAIAERLRETLIATTDRRHFSVVRPKHVAAFDLIP